MPLCATTEALHETLAAILSHNPCFVVTNYHLVETYLDGRPSSAVWEMHSCKSKSKIYD
jgi:hypothetical protein